MTGNNLAYRAAGGLTTGEKAVLHAMVEQVADEFVPSLARRTSTTQRDLASPQEGSVAAYVAEMLTQDALLVTTHEGAPAAFMSFRPAYVHPMFAVRGPCVYVSTVAVMPRYRRAGYARSMYRALFSLSRDRSRWVLLRTWGGNCGHLTLLSDLGFEILARIPDDRGPGIDTVYLGRQARSRDHRDLPRTA